MLKAVKSTLLITQKIAAACKTGLAMTVNSSSRQGFLKKQTQFYNVQKNVSVYMKGFYVDCCGFGRRKNKAKQTQICLAPSTAGGFKTNSKKQTQFAGL
jgi:hypothetical protein